MKQTILIVLFVLLCTLTVACIRKDAMRNKYKINYIGKYSNFASIKNKKAPIYARAGEKVTVCYPLGTTDTKYTFKLDDEILNPQFIPIVNNNKSLKLCFLK